jgi:hypothetical protein
MSESTAAARATCTFLALEQKHTIDPTGLHVRSKDQSSRRRRRESSGSTCFAVGAQDFGLAIVAVFCDSLESVAIFLNAV